MAALSASTHFDWRLAPYDIAGSRAHARVLHDAGLLTDDELDRMIRALDALEADVASGAFTPDGRRRGRSHRAGTWAAERAGAELGGKLRAGRSRNDQVATLFRMWLRDAARRVARGRARRRRRAGRTGRRHIPAPSCQAGPTCRHAQPVLLAHHLLAHAQALLRDVDRLRDWDRRTAFSPYGSGALAGSSLGLDPAAVAAELGLRRAGRELHRRHRVA